MRRELLFKRSGFLFLPKPNTMVSTLNKNISRKRIRSLQKSYLIARKKSLLKKKPNCSTLRKKRQKLQSFKGLKEISKSQLDLTEQRAGPWTTTKLSRKLLSALETKTRSKDHKYQKTANVTQASTLRLNKSSLTKTTSKSKKWTRSRSILTTSIQNQKRSMINQQTAPVTKSPRRTRSL